MWNKITVIAVTSLSVLIYTILARVLNLSIKRSIVYIILFLAIEIFLYIGASFIVTHNEFSDIVFVVVEELIKLSCFLIIGKNKNFLSCVTAFSVVEISVIKPLAIHFYEWQIKNYIYNNVDFFAILYYSAFFMHIITALLLLFIKDVRYALIINILIHYSFNKSRELYNSASKLNMLIAAVELSILAIIAVFLIRFLFIAKGGGLSGDQVEKPNN